MGLRGFTGGPPDLRRVCTGAARCTWHKRENVVEKLKRKEDQEAVRQQLSDAYHQDTYGEAKQCLGSICDALRPRAIPDRPKPDGRYGGDANATSFKRGQGATAEFADHQHHETSQQSSQRVLA